MQSSQHSIPIPHRQQRDGVHVPAAVNATSYHEPQFVGASHHVPSSQFDDEFWGVFDIDIDDLNAGPSFPSESETYGLTRPPVLPNNLQLFNPSAGHWAANNTSQVQADWDVSSNLVLPTRPHAVSRNGLTTVDVPQQSQRAFGDIWPGRPLQNGQILESPRSACTGSSFFSERDSLRISRMPSLGTNPSLRTLSWESPPDVPEIYGASQWAGISSFSPKKEHDVVENTEPDAIAQRGIAPDGRSSGIESQYGTSPVTVHEDNGAQAPSWFDYGNQVTQPQGVPNFLEHMPFFFSDGVDIPHSNSSEIHTDFQFFGSDAETQIGHDFGANHHTLHPPIAHISLSPLSSGSQMQYTPRSGMTMEVSLSSQEFAGYNTSGISSPISPVSPWQASQVLNHETFNNFTYANTVNCLAPHDLAPFHFPQPREAYGPEVAAVGDEMEGVEETYDCFVMENGRGQAVTPPSAREKGRRGGHLKPEVAQSIAIKRKEGKTCLRCRVARTTCDGQDPCGRCVRLGEPAMSESPCIKANFVEIVKSGTCNYISQRNINHLTLDETHRVKIILPETFDVSECLRLLNTRKRRFNVRARQASGSLYVLDLAKCFDFLVKLPHTSHSGGLRTFIDDILVKTDPWHKCVREVDPTKNKTLLLSQWNNMPSRASYDLVPLDKNSPERPLDPEDERDRQEIILAAQMSRIICRKLELDGYKALQSLINNMRTHNTTYSQRKAAVQQLGKILVSLRWRMSWWQLLGDGSGQGDVYRDRFVQRVEELTRTLYFYYFPLRRSVGKFVEMGGLEGQVSRYPDAEPVWDEFPAVQSVEGFEAWLEKGRELIKEGNVERRFSV